MDSAKHRAEVPVRYHEVSSADPAGPLDPDSPGMLNAPFTGTGIKRARHEMSGTPVSLVVCSSEEDPTHGKSADA